MIKIPKHIKEVVIMAITMLFIGSVKKERRKNMVRNNSRKNKVSNQI